MLVVMLVDAVIGRAISSIGGTTVATNRNDGGNNATDTGPERARSFKMEEIKPLSVVKTEVDAALKAKQPVAGMKFINEKGSVGTILPELSLRQKLQASMTCVEGGPDHIRERSDWHQCYLSPEKAKNKPRKTGGPNTGKSMRTEAGVLLRFEDILEGDTDEVKALKEQNNIAFGEAKAARDAMEASEKQNKLAARQAKQESDRAARKVLQDAEKAKKLAEGAKTIAEYAASVNAKISAKAPQVAAEPEFEIDAEPVSA